MLGDKRISGEASGFLLIPQRCPERTMKMNVQGLGLQLFSGWGDSTLCILARLNFILSATPDVPDVNLAGEPTLGLVGFEPTQFTAQCQIG